MTIALALLTKEGILLAADNGDYFEEENNLKETAQKIFAWSQQGIAFMHAGVAGRTVKGQHLETRDQLKAFMRSMPITDVEPVRNTANSLFCFLYEQWRDFLKKDEPSDKVELLIAGYDKGAPVCATLDIYHRLDECKQEYHTLSGGLLVTVRLAPRMQHMSSISAISAELSADEPSLPLLSLGGKQKMVDEILGHWPNKRLPRPSNIADIASAIPVARFIILEVANRDPSRISSKMQIAQIVDGRFAWIGPPPGIGSTSHTHRLTESSSP